MFSTSSALTVRPNECCTLCGDDSWMPGRPRCRIRWPAISCTEVTNALAIFRKELRCYLAMPIGRVLLAISALFFGLMVYSSGDDAVRLRIAMPVFALTRFRPSPELSSHEVLLVVGFARVIAMYLIPMITMRLFPEEKQAHTIELLLTSPVNEMDIVWGKWVAALTLYLALIGVGALEFAVVFWTKPDWMVILICYSALTIIGASLVAVGQCISTFTKHQLVAAAMTLVVSLAVLRFCDTGMVDAKGVVLCVLLTVLGWACTFRSVRALRETY